MKKRNLKTLLVGLLALSSMMFTSCASQIEQDAKALARYACQTNYLFEQSQQSNETGAANAEKYNALIIQFDSVKKEFEKVYTEEKAQEEFQKLFDKYSKDCDGYVKELTEQSSNSNEKTDLTTSMSVESAVLFDELNGDLAITSEKYTDKRIVIKNVLVYGGFVNKEQKREVFCTPYNMQKNSRAIFINSFATINLLENFNFNDLSAFFNEYNKNKESMFETSVYYLGNNKLGIINEGGRTDGCFSFILRNPTDYKKFKLPSLVKLNDPQNRNYPSYVASFTELVDIEGNITMIKGGENSVAYMELSDAVIVKQTPYPLTKSNNNVMSEINVELDNNKQIQDGKQKEQDIINDAKTIEGSWKGVVNGKNVILDIGIDNMEQIYGSYTIDGNYTPINGRVEGKTLHISFNGTGVIEVHYKELNYNTELVGYITKIDHEEELEGDRKTIILKRH